MKKSILKGLSFLKTTNTRCIQQYSTERINIVEERVLEAMRKHESIANNEINSKTTYAELGLDSLDSMEIIMFVEEEFEIEIPEGEGLSFLSVGSLVEYILSLDVEKKQDDL